MKPFKFFDGGWLQHPVEDVTEEIDSPTVPSYYDVDPNFICVGVTPRKTNPDTYEPYRHLVYEEVATGRMIQANIINTEHPMYNFYREIEPEFYNSHYLNG